MIKFPHFLKNVDGKRKVGQVHIKRIISHLFNMSMLCEPYGDSSSLVTKKIWGKNNIDNRDILNMRFLFYQRNNRKLKDFICKTEYVILIL